MSGYGKSPLVAAGVSGSCSPSTIAVVPKVYANCCAATIARRVQPLRGEIDLDFGIGFFDRDVRAT